MKILGEIIVKKQLFWRIYQKWILNKLFSGEKVMINQLFDYETD